MKYDFLFIESIKQIFLLKRTPKKARDSRMMLLF